MRLCSRTLPPPTARLSPVVPLLARIKTLTLEISSWDQCKKPKIKRSRKIIYRDFDPSPERSLPPHRLDRSGILRLPLETLVLPSSDATRSLLAFLSYLVFVFLDPLTVVYSKAEGVREGVNTWIGRPISSDLSFLEGWTRLERVTWAGPHLFGRCFDPGVDRIIPMYAAEDLTASTRPDRRTLKFVLDLAAHAEPGAPVRSPMGTFLGGAGISQELAGRVRLAVKLIVYAAEEVAVRDEVAGLELWTKELILVETV